MVTFVYTAKNLDTGEMVKAEVQADSDQSAAKLLMGQRLYPISIEPKDVGGLMALVPFVNHIGYKDRVIFTRQLATLINAGLPLVQSLRTVRDQVTNKPLQLIIDDIIASVEGGKSLAAAFALHPDVFNVVYVNLVAAGESSGTLDKALERLATQQEKDAAILSKIRSALIYPFIVLIVMVGVVIFMLTTVLPQIGSLYKDLGKQLPPLTAALLAVSNFIVNQWYLALIILAGIGYGFYYFFKSEKGKRLADTFKLKMPLFGQLFRKMYMARFARTLGTLVATGVPLLESLNIVKNAVNNSLVADSVEKASIKVKGGKSLSSSLENDPNFLRLVPQMIAIGERSGAMDDMLDRVATFYEDEVDEQVKNISTVIEPAMMVILGITVGLIIASILLPIYSLIGSGGLNNIK
ncbi:MAG TPA: type II secretion system F family protein [Candidatus Nanoarchaeia archaeon]|nr:type II secretion system F family protein [Candidatus Nanoarchaeia archaeon]